MVKRNKVGPTPRVPPSPSPAPVVFKKNKKKKKRQTKRKSQKVSETVYSPLVHANPDYKYNNWSAKQFYNFVEAVYALTQWKWVDTDRWDFTTWKTWIARTESLVEEDDIPGIPGEGNKVFIKILGTSNRYHMEQRGGLFFYCRNILMHHNHENQMGISRIIEKFNELHPDFLKELIDNVTNSLTNIGDIIWGFNGRGPVEKSAADLDKELEKYHSESMQT
ncbi:hypothetical protein ACFE04_007260 [Oxalis oulophora]